MSNLLAEAINCDDADRAGKIIRDALGIESDDVVGYCFPREWPQTASSALATSGRGWRPKRATSPRDRRPPLPVALVGRGT
jgi:hypothetical protein